MSQANISSCGSSDSSSLSRRSQDSSATTNVESLIEPDASGNNEGAPGGVSENTDRSSSSTRSLTQSILDYPMENGRRYHKYREGSYMYPNDDLENERLDLQHEFLKIVFGGKIHFAPLQNPRRILDIGTGTGIWPVEMADTFPEAEVIGTDLSATQPDWVPDNVHFVVDDATEEDWLYPSDHFDLIHSRLLLGCFEDFRDIIRKGFKYTKPGGWMESQEPMSMAYCDDGTMPEDWTFNEWSKIGDDAAMSHGKPLRIANKLKRWYEQAGFVDVHEVMFKIPMNPWPKDPTYKNLGRVRRYILIFHEQCTKLLFQISELNWLQGIQAMCLAWFHRVHGWTKDEIEVYLVNVRKAVQDRSVHAYHKL
ncbi:MAG: hypothetical protein M1837_003518 [Sclerophora amabilis]|nr:MAG: hypothetical protein M1837_003518 [Sclerophora amabilis]